MYHFTSRLSGAAAQEAIQAFLAKRRKDVDVRETRSAFDKIMSRTRRGCSPSMREIDEGIRRG